jgi:uncharacterized membrane protein
MRRDQPAGGRLRILGDPVHPSLVHFPIALLSLVPLAQALGLFGEDPFWWGVAHWLLVGGLVMAGVAALTGFVDFTAVPREDPARGTALVHMMANLLAVLLYLGSFAVQGGPDVPESPFLPFALSVVGVAVLLFSGYLGGHLVFSHGLGLSEKALPPPAKPQA